MNARHDEHGCEERVLSAIARGRPDARQDTREGERTLRMRTSRERAVRRGASSGEVFRTTSRPAERECSLQL